MTTKECAEALYDAMEAWAEGETDINAVLQVQCILDQWNESS